MAIPLTVFWVLIRFGNSLYTILVARFCAGLTGGGFQTGAVLFVSEIADRNYRGRLGSLIPLTRNLGVLIAFIIVPIVKYEYVPYIFFWIPVPIFVGLLLIPNSPQHYVHREKFQDAKKALQWYKGCDGKNENQNVILGIEFDRLKQVDEERKNSPKVELKDFTNRLALKGIFCSLALSWFTQLSGCYFLTNYASFFLTEEKTGSKFYVDISSIILIVAQIVGGLLSAKIGDTFTRKNTIRFSLCGCIVGFGILSIYLYLHQNGVDVSYFTWLPVVCLSFTIFIASAGIAAIVNTCVLENFPTKIRTPGMSCFSMSMNFVQFVVEKFFPILVERLNLHGVFILIVINCCIGLVFVAFMNETKGKLLDSTDSDQNKQI